MGGNRWPGGEIGFPPPERFRVQNGKGHDGALAEDGGAARASSVQARGGNDSGRRHSNRVVCGGVALPILGLRAPRVLEHVLGFAVFAALAFVLLLYEGRVYQSGVYKSTLRYSGIYQDEQEGEALVVPQWVLRVASATAIAAGGLFTADFAVGEIVGLRPVPLSAILAGAVLAYMQLVAVRPQRDNI